MIRAHEFIEGLDEKNYKIDFYNTKAMDSWFKPDMDILLLSHSKQKISIQDACKNALYNFCLMADGKWDKEGFCSSETPDSFKRFMQYGLEGYACYIDYLQSGNAAIEDFYPQHIFRESNLRTLNFMNMCKEYSEDMDHQSIHFAIDRYQALVYNAWEMINISWNDPKRTEPEVEKMREVRDSMIRSNEIFIDTIKSIKKAVHYRN